MVTSRVKNAMQVERGHRKQATENCYGFKQNNQNEGSRKLSGVELGSCTCEIVEITT